MRRVVVAAGPITTRWLLDFQRDMRHFSPWGLCAVTQGRLIRADTGQSVGQIDEDPATSLINMLEEAADSPISILIVDPSIRPYPSFLAKTEDATYRFNSEGTVIGLYDLTTAETSTSASFTMLRSDVVPRGRVCWPAVLIHSRDRAAWSASSTPVIRSLLASDPLHWALPRDLAGRVVRVEESVQIVTESEAAGKVLREPQLVLLEPAQGDPPPTTTTNPDLSVVIPTGFGRTKQGAYLIEQCLQTLVANESLTAQDEVVVVGYTGGRESLIDRLTRLVPGISFIKDSPDFNYSRRVNLGVSKARNQVVALLNDDVSATIGALRTVARELSRGYAAAAPLLVDPEASFVRAAADTCDSNGPRHLFRGWPVHRYQALPWATGTREVGLLSAACLMVRRHQFMEVGGFSLRLPRDFGDSDFCLKLRSSGGRLGLVQDVAVRHIEGASKPRASGTEDFTFFAGLWPDVSSLDDTWIWGDGDRLGGRAS